MATAFNRKGGSKSPRISGAARAKVTDPPLQVRIERVTDEHAPCDAPFRPRIVDSY